MNPTQEPDLEEQIILRLPQQYATLLDEKIRNNTLTPQDLKLKARSDRVFQLEFMGSPFEGILSDLPCIIESQKTLDNEMFYKSADISQILLFNHPGQRADTTLVYRDFKYPHGLTAPMQDARKKKFRPIKRFRKKNTIDVESEVKALLQEDSNAWKVEYELLTQELEFQAEEDEEAEEYDELDEFSCADQDSGRALDTQTTSEIDQQNEDEYDDIGLDTEISDVDSE